MGKIDVVLVASVERGIVYAVHGGGGEDLDSMNIVGDNCDEDIGQR
jgi:hypothetical protein